MGSHQQPRRPFNPDVLTPVSSTSMHARIGGGAIVWRFTLLLPIDETKPGAETEEIATVGDQESLEHVLADHFKGLSVLSEINGHGLRDGNPEENTLLPFVIYAAPVTESEKYFGVLKKELEEALVQDTILVERQELWLL